MIENKSSRAFWLMMVAPMLWWLGSGEVRGDDAGLQASTSKTTILIHRGEVPILRYRFGEVPYKPYADRLDSPRGVNILRDSPADHAHHHALMFALGVDGVDFWGEAPAANPGRQVSRDISSEIVTSRDGTSVARIRHELVWTAANDEPKLVEDRALSVYGDPGLPATVLTWHSRLMPGGEERSVTLDGSHYFGLGMRFVESMDGKGPFLNARGLAGEVVRGQERLVRAEWCAYRGWADEEKITVAVFDHPGNPRHPATMFTMPEPFAYLSATLNVWKEPLVLTASKPLDLRYGVAVWDGHVKEAQIDSLYRRWTEIASRPAADE